MHLIDVEQGMLGAAPIVAGTISLALGAALASQIRRDGRVVVSFFGDGATGEGVLYEAMNFAALKKLPLIFACENNLYSTHMPIGEIRVAMPIAEVARPFGMPSHRLDGNDLVAIHEAAVDVVAACRQGGGPALMEFLTYRMRGHVGPNDNIQGTLTDIRPAAEIEHWRARDPIARFEAFALDGGLVTAGDLAAIREAITSEVEEAHRFAAASPRPVEVEIGNYVFRT
jgi:TPP-dependent pyruvate/acetoin dehydrogenase alpha subunit